ncbi:MAG: tripartite tricarboxylate transporter substrate binding protein [Burkholderiales bacterium]
MTIRCGGTIAAFTGISCMAACACSSALAQYPDRPIRYIVPSAAGGSPDVGARILTAELGRFLGQQLVVDNRAGASGSIGTDLIAKALPDGYTIGPGNIQTLAINRILLRLPYDPDKDLRKIVYAYSTPNVLAVNEAMPVRSVKELVEHARANPGKLLHAGVVGSSNHLSSELFKLMTGTRMSFIPYKGAQQAITEMIGGQVHLMLENSAALLPHVRAGRVRGLAVTSVTRSRAAPELPTIDEAGVPGFEMTAWSGLIAPAGVPAAVVARLNAGFNRALALPAVREKLIAMGLEATGGTPEQFEQHVRSEAAKWADVVKRAGVRLE